MSANISSDNGNTKPRLLGDYSRPIRMRLVEKPGWVAGRYTSDDILGWIADIKPSIIERMINEVPYQDPARSLDSKYTVSSFCKAVNELGVQFTCRLGCEIINNNGGDTKEFFQTSSSYLALLKASENPNTIYEVDLDNFNQFALAYPEKVEAVIAGLYAQGWKSVGQACWGSYRDDHDLCTFTMIDFGGYETWNYDEQKKALISEIRSKSPNIQKIIGSIDNPSAQSALLQVIQRDGKRRVEEILSGIFQNQAQGGYVFSPCFLQLDSGNAREAWDAKSLGLYDFLKAEMGAYNRRGEVSS